MIFSIKLFFIVPVPELEPAARLGYLSG